MQALITPDEAVRIFGKSGINDSWLPALKLAEQILMHPNWNYPELYPSNALLACLFWAGRIQGIREERLRNKQRSIIHDTPEAKFGKPIHTTAGLILPTLRMDCFINTDEGGRLYAVCTAASDEAMRPYKEAKTAWEAEHK